MKRSKRSLGKKLAVWAAAASLALTGTVTAWASERLDTVTDTYWDEDDDTVAMWEEVEDAYQYEVYLYLDDSKVASIKTKKTKYNFEKKLTKEGEYTFRVRALAKNKDKDFRDGAWSDYSDGLYISSDYAELIKNGGKIDTENSGPGAKKDAAAETTEAAETTTDAAAETTETAEATETAAAEATETAAAAETTAETAEPTPDGSIFSKGEWIQDETGWWYRNANGTYPANCWFQDPANGKWYFFNEAGYMMTGWIDWNDQKYYCNADGTPSGAMVTGENMIDGVLYIFDESGVLQAEQ